MDDLLTPEEKTQVINFVACTLGVCNHEALVEAGAQAYKEKLSKLAEPELREAIELVILADRRCDKTTTESTNGIISLLAPYLIQARQEERDRIVTIVADNYCPGHCVQKAGEEDCVKCWQEVLKDGK